jgi:hypothetical protein
VKAGRAPRLEDNRRRESSTVKSLLNIQRLGEWASLSKKLSRATPRNERREVRGRNEIRGEGVYTPREVGALSDRSHRKEKNPLLLLLGKLLQGRRGGERARRGLGLACPPFAPSLALRRRSMWIACRSSAERAKRDIQLHLSSTYNLEAGGCG